MTRAQTRRALILLGGATALVAGLRSFRWDRHFTGKITFTEMIGLAPFRQIETTGRISAANLPFIGLEAGPASTAALAVAAAVRDNPCRALFGAAQPDGRIPIAYFSEVRCPVCRVLETDLDQILADRGDQIRLVHHHLPIFGPASELAARAAIAAARQGQEDALRARLARAALVTDARYIATVAASLGLDPDRLLVDMADAETDASLARARALAGLFGFPGTPGLVIGRTVIAGGVGRAVLDQVIDAELQLSPIVCPAS